MERTKMHCIYVVLKLLLETDLLTLPEVKEALNKKDNYKSLLELLEKTYFDYIDNKEGGPQYPFF